MENNDYMVRTVTVLAKDFNEYTSTEKKISRFRPKLATGLASEGKVYKFTDIDVPVVDDVNEMMRLIFEPKDYKEKRYGKQYFLGIKRLCSKYMKEHGYDDEKLKEVLKETNGKFFEKYRTMTFSEYKAEHQEFTEKSIVQRDDVDSKDRHFYYLSLNNNVECCPATDGTMIDYAFRDIIHVNKGFFKEGYVGCYIIGELVDGIMIDVVLNEAIVNYTKAKANEEPILQLSYYDSIEMPKERVVEQLKQFTSEDISRYKEAMEKVREVTDQKYYNFLVKLGEKEKAKERKAKEERQKTYCYNEGFDNFIDDFKKRYRKENK